MQDGKISPTRLARYAAMAAGTVTAGAQADVQGYFGPPIQLSSSEYTLVTLEAGGVQFEAFQAVNVPFSGSIFSNLYTTCCDFGKSGGCISTQTIGTQAVNSSSSAYLTSCVDAIRLQPYVAEGQQVDDAIFTNSFCGASIYGGQFVVSNINCNSTDTTVNSSFEQFVALELVDPKTGETYFGWLEIDGTHDNRRIVAWAFEDSGGPITVGDRGEKPITCQQADLNGDGKVDAADLGLMLGFWGDCE